MHPNFYHWHSKAEIKPDTSILEARWNAAAKFAENCSAVEIVSLLRLVLFPSVDPNFAQRYGAALLVLEPTFKPDRNGQLLRVMAAASLYSKMESFSPCGTVIALGMHAANFPQERTDPVCEDAIQRGMEYLSKGAEHAHPKIYAEPLVTAEKKVEASLAALKASVAGADAAKTAAGIEAYGKAVFAGVKESHTDLGKVINRLSEESQLLWWLVGRRSPLLEERRERITSDIYAIPAALEAAQRVTVLPPAESLEALLEEALSQCQDPAQGIYPLVGLLSSVNTGLLNGSAANPASPDLMPVTALLSEITQNRKPTGALLKSLKLSPKTTVTPVDLSRQYFRELMLSRALGELR